MIEPKSTPKSNAQHLVKMAEYHLANGDLQKAKASLEAAYPLIDKAYPTKWAADLLSVSASVRAQLRRFGVEVARTTPKDGWKTFEQGRVNPRRRNPDLVGHYDVKSADDVMNYDEPYLLTTVGRVKSYIRPYTGPGADRPEARGFHDVRFDDDRIKPKAMGSYLIADAITAANIDRAVQSARRDAMDKHRVQHAMLTENPRRRKNPAAKAKPQSRAARTVKRVQEALAAGVILPFSTMRFSGTAGPYHEAVGGKNNFAIFRDHKGAAKDDYYPSAFSAADHLVSFIGEGNAIEALKEAAKKVGLRYVNLDTPIPWATGRRRF